MNKKIGLVFMAVVLTASYAQAQLNFGIRAGFNMTDMNVNTSAFGMNISPKTKMLPGFQVGIVADYAVSNNFSIQPAVVYATQGMRQNINESIELLPGFLPPIEINEKNRTSLNYIQVPVNAIYRVDFGFAGLLLQAGPYFGYALSGKFVSESIDDDLSGIGIIMPNERGEFDIEFGSGNDEMRRFDFGVGFGAGLQFGALQAVLGYNIGLSDLTNLDNSTMKNNGLALTLTYLFGR